MSALNYKLVKFGRFESNTSKARDITPQTSLNFTDNCMMEASQCSPPNKRL